MSVQLEFHKSSRFILLLWYKTANNNSPITAFIFCNISFTTFIALSIILLAFFYIHFDHFNYKNYYIRSNEKIIKIPGRFWFQSWSFLSLLGFENIMLSCSFLFFLLPKIVLFLSSHSFSLILLCFGCLIWSSDSDS